MNTSGERRRWPLRRKMVVLVLTIETAGLLMTTTGFLMFAFDAWYAETDDGLREAQRVLAGRPYPGGGTPPPALDGIIVEVVDGSGNPVAVPHRASGAAAGLGAPPPAELAPALGAGTPMTVGSSGASWRVLAQPLPDGAWLVAARPVGGLQHLRRDLIIAWIIAAAVAFLATSALAVGLVRHGMRPLTRLAEAAERLRAGGPSRLPVDGADEIARLAATLNGLLDQLESTLDEQREIEERQRRFVDDAGHELRSPVATIRGWADLYRWGGIPSGDLPTAMRRIGDEAHRLGALVDELLTLARHDRRSPTTRRRVIDLAEVVRDAVLDARAADPGRPFTAELPPLGTATVVGDPFALHRVVANLLENVSAHTPAGTPGRVSLERAHDRVVLRVADDGPGVAESLRDRLFDLFVSADPARTRRPGGGVGLGLSVVAAIVAAHGGEAGVEADGTGLTVRISLPAAEPVSAVTVDP